MHYLKWTLMGCVVAFGACTDEGEGQTRSPLTIDSFDDVAGLRAHLVVGGELVSIVSTTAAVVSVQDLSPLTELGDPDDSPVAPSTTAVRTTTITSQDGTVYATWRTELPNGDVSGIFAGHRFGQEETVETDSDPSVWTQVVQSHAGDVLQAVSLGSKDSLDDGADASLADHLLILNNMGTDLWQMAGMTMPAAGQVAEASGRRMVTDVWHANPAFIGAQGFRAKTAIAGGTGTSFVRLTEWCTPNFSTPRKCNVYWSTTHVAGPGHEARVSTRAHGTCGLGRHWTNFHAPAWSQGGKDCVWLFGQN